MTSPAGAMVLHIEPQHELAIRAGIARTKAEASEFYPRRRFELSCTGDDGDVDHRRQRRQRVSARTRSGRGHCTCRPEHAPAGSAVDFGLTEA
jgi:hypothetical protein